MPLARPPAQIVYTVDRFSPGIYQTFFHRLQRALGGTRVRITNYYRSPEHNARVGGARGSQHQIGTAIDLVFPDWRSRRSAIDALRRQGLIAVDEGDHVHVQAWPAQTALAILRAVGIRV